MKAEKIYQALKELAEKFDITVSEQNFEKTGVRIKSGFCIVKDQKRFIINKRLNIYRKIHLLAAYLSSLPNEDIYIVPAVREVLDKHSEK